MAISINSFMLLTHIHIGMNQILIIKLSGFYDG